MMNMHIWEPRLVMSLK